MKLYSRVYFGQQWGYGRITLKFQEPKKAKNRLLRWSTLELTSIRITGEVLQLLKGFLQLSGLNSTKQKEISFLVALIGLYSHEKRDR